MPANPNDLVGAEPVSELFLSCFSRGGHYVADCSMCGRTHFAADAGDCIDVIWFQRIAESAPNRYVEHKGCDSVTVVDINGATFVEGCPCNNARRFEAFVLNEYRAILDFLRAYKGARLADAVEVMAQMDGADLDSP